VVIARLSDGTRVRIRPISPDDKRLLADSLGRLSEQTVYRRFMAPKPRFTAAELRYLTEVDGQDHVALVAELADEPRELVAVARFVRLVEDRHTAEAAVVVGDAFQGRGLGTKLALMLADEARMRGIRRFSAAMLSDNAPAHRLMRRVSERLERTPSGAVDELVVELAA
jgi:RimJ/RimL family protein N-acetyltransferase